MIVTTTTDRIINSLSFTERCVVQSLAKHLTSDNARLVMSALADKEKISRSNAVNAITKLSAAGVLESRSMGMKGVFIKVLNREAFDTIVKEISD